MEAYAVIETGGKQYRVQKNDIVDVEKLEGEAGSKVAFDNVLAVSDGTSLSVGQPHVDGAKVKAEIVEQRKGPKVIAFKKKKRKGYRRKIGHRQQLTRLKITELG
jgi:large subunit ribosomal protein L21